MLLNLIGDLYSSNYGELFDHALKNWKKTCFSDLLILMVNI